MSKNLLIGMSVAGWLVAAVAMGMAISATNRRSPRPQEHQDPQHQEARSANPPALQLQLALMEPEPKQRDTIHVFRGHLLKAAMVGAEDLVGLRQREIKDASDVDDLSQCFARLESYDVAIAAFEKEKYVVRVIPVRERCIKDGRDIRGGAAQYEISAKDFQILARLCLRPTSCSDASVG